MRKKEFCFLVLLTAINSGLASAATSVTTVPEGMLTFNLSSGKASYLSLPLTAQALYTGTVNTVTTNTITVDDAPAPFTSNLAAPDSPCFLKFLSGNEAGRVMLVTKNSSSQLTVDTTDHVSRTAVALTATSFNVQSGDKFEIFPGDTLATVFGAGTTSDPALLTGARTVTYADTVAIFNAAGAAQLVYYFNSVASRWERAGSVASANNTIIYPYSAFVVTRRAPHPDTTLVVAGRVTQVAAATKVLSLGTVYTSTHYASDISLSQLRFGSNWQKGMTAVTADNLSVWNSSTSKFDTFYQKPDSTWRMNTDANTDQSGYVIAAGSVTTIAKHEAVSGGATFLESTLPYSLN